MSTIETSVLTPEQIKVRNNEAVTDTILFMSEVIPQIKQDMQKLLAGAVDKEALLARLFGAGIDQQKLIGVIGELERLTTESEEAQQKVSSFDEKNEIHNQYLLRKAVLLDELSQVMHGFSHFRNSYGDEYAINFLKVVRDLKETSDTEIENVVVERIRRFTAEDLNAITEYWICERPECFMNLLHKYPGVLSAIHIFAQRQKKPVDSLFDAMDEVCGIESPLSVSVEYVARHIGAMNEQASEILRDFLQARLNVVTSMFGMLDVLAKQNKLTQYVDTDKAVVLSDDKAVEEQQAREMLQSEENFSKVAALYASFTKEKLEDVDREIKESGTKDKTALYQKKAKLQLKLVILKGEDNVDLAQTTDVTDVNREVSSVTGFKPSELSLQQRLHIVECQDELKTYLHFAIEYSNIQAIIYLIENGADISAKNSQKQTPLMLAFDQKESKVILNAVLDGLEKHFVAQNNQNAQRHINLLRDEINHGIVNKNNVDAKFSTLMTRLTAKPAKNNPVRGFFSGRSRTASAPTAVLPKKVEPHLKRSQSEGDLRKAGKESAQASEKRKQGSSKNLASPRVKTADEIRLELIELTKARIKSIQFPTETSLDLLTTKEDLDRKVDRFNRYNQVLSTLKGDSFCQTKRMDGNKLRSSLEPVTGRSLSSLSVEERLNLASNFMNDRDSETIFSKSSPTNQLPAKKQNKIISEAKELFFKIVERFLGKKLDDKLPRFLISKDKAYREAFNKLWPRDTVSLVQAKKTEVDSAAIVKASMKMGMLSEPKPVLRVSETTAKANMVSGISISPPAA